jgi:hypothetical protein
MGTKSGTNLYLILAAAGAGFIDPGKTTLAHFEYHLIQSWWHPTKNLGKLPGDYTHKSGQFVWLRCLGCRHECGRHHEWKVRVAHLTRVGRQIVCPSCDGKRGLCECQSVANHPRLSREWHPDNPPATDVSKSSRRKVVWLCPEGHPPYTASCAARCTYNSGCPVCGATRRTRHPVVSVGRPDLALEWDTKRNTNSPSEVTLGSKYMAGWVCSSNPDHAPWQAMVQNRALRGNGCPGCNKDRGRSIIRPPRQFGSITY